MKHYSIYIYIVCVTITLVLSSCSTHRQSLNPDKTAREQRHRHEVLVGHLSAKRQSLLEEARTWIGTPYKYAGQEKGSGTDCSGLIMQLYMQCLNYPIPRNSAKQAEFCRKVIREESIPGDLVFFATGKDPEKVSHVGMLMDSESFIHASSSKGVVISRLDNPWYAARLVMYGRIPCLEN